MADWIAFWSSSCTEAEADYAARLANRCVNTEELVALLSSNRLLSTENISWTSTIDFEQKFNTTSGIFIDLYKKE